ncbi:3-deoxy-D-manno-octulosonic acid kinase [Thioalkalivibrio thiocyanoxidans]|uniref:3-deoxy-D-manno-octulosonic acid kinase n=1 Tax=Thioalkalivibrio thiocyanoxidans TaxID=152475 RepID=UPI003CC56026
MPDDNRVHIPRHRPDARALAPDTANHAPTSPGTCLEPLARNRWILQDTSLLPTVSEELFQPQWLRQQGAITATRTGRRTTHFLRHEELDLVLRHYWRGGWIAKLSEDHYWWTGLARTRPLQEWHLLRALYDLGLPVPRPVAARVVRQGLWYSGDLITTAIPKALPLDEYIREGLDTPALWRGIGTAVARFHNAGTWHADLNVRNILVGPGDEVWLIDWDRGRLGVHRGLERNLTRLQRSLAKWSGTRERGARGWSHLLQGYNDERKPA